MHPFSDASVRRLFKLGFGYPLWQAELPEDRIKVQIGDVGYLRQGQFHRLFNAFKEADPLHREGVPSRFKPFKAAQIVRQFLCLADDRSPTERGRLVVTRLVTGREGVLGEENLVQKGDRKMRQYMKSHIDSWLVFASKVTDERLAVEDLVFIQGHFAVKQRVIAALIDDGRSSGTSVGPYAQVHSDTMDVASLASDPYRHGSAEGDCIFIHYLKMKARTAQEQGKNSMPHPGAYVGNVGESEADPYDPVMCVLDYILLKEPEAYDTAVASDMDLRRACLLPDSDRCVIPDDVSGLLSENAPEVESIGEERVGQLLFSDDMLESLSVIDTGYELDSLEIGEGPYGNFAQDSQPPIVDAHGLEPPYTPVVGLAQVPARAVYSLISGERRSATSALAFSPQGQYVAAGFENNAIVVWDVMQNAAHHQFNGHSADVSALVFSPDGNKLVSGGRDGKVFLWDLVAGGYISDKSAHDDLVNCVAYSHDGKLFASAAGDFIVKLWDAETGNLVAQTEEHSDIIMALAFSPDNERFVSACAGGTAHVWSTHGATSICALTGHEGVIYTISYSPDGRKLVTGSDDGTCRVWSALIGEEYMTLSEVEGGPVWAAAFSPDGREVHYIGSERTLKTFDSVTADEICSIECGEKVGMSMTFSSDGRLFAAGGDDHMVTVWDMSTREELISLHGHTNNVTHVVFSKDNRYLATASDDGYVRVWDLPCLLPPAPQTAEDARA